MLTLYYTKGTIALSTHILLEEVGADYEAKLIDFAKQDQLSPEYLKINPRGRVPALVTDTGIITEANAIQVYIAQTWPEQNLLPESPYGFAKAMEFNGYLASTVHVAHAHKFRASRWADDEAAQQSMRDKVTENMTDCAAMIESDYLMGPYVMGDQYTICDPYLFNITRWMPGDGVDMNKFGKLVAHREHMLKRPAVQRVSKMHE